MHRQVAIISALAFFVFSVTAALNASFHVDEGFVRDRCYARILDYLKNGTLAQDDAVFFRDPTTGTPMIDPENLTLTLAGCQKLCGTKRQWYIDIGPRLSVWLIPCLLLISSIELSPLDKRRFFAIAHLLGDPIHSCWSLIDKIAAWDYCYRLAQQRRLCKHCTRIIATIYAGFEELEGAQIFDGISQVENADAGSEARQDGSQPYLDYLAIQHKLSTKSSAWRRTALELANSRTDEILRTGLTIVVYVYQIIGGFVKQVGGEPSSPPGGRIATGLLLSWLIPTILLSNVIGNFPSRHTCFEILERFAKSTRGPRIEEYSTKSVLLKGFPAFRQVSSEPYIEARSWSGAIYTFRPWVRRRNARSQQRRWPKPSLTLVLSLLPLHMSIIGASLILWNLIPKGFNCRHTWSIAVFLAWLFSALLTWLSHTPTFATGKYHFYFTLIKDVLIALPSVTIMFLSACGLFNDAKCWSGYLYYRGNAHVPLNTHSFFVHNDSTLYQYIVWSCIGLQGLVFLFVVVKWRKGLGVLRWSGAARREERERMRDGYVCSCVAPPEPCGNNKTALWIVESLTRQPMN